MQTRVYLIIFHAYWIESLIFFMDGHRTPLDEGD